VRKQDRKNEGRKRTLCKHFKILRNNVSIRVGNDRKGGISKIGKPRARYGRYSICLSIVCPSSLPLRPSPSPSPLSPRLTHSPHPIPLASSLVPLPSPLSPPLASSLVPPPSPPRPFFLASSLVPPPLPPPLPPRVTYSYRYWWATGDRAWLREGTREERRIMEDGGG
jgi:hypothetical protein